MDFETSTTIAPQSGLFCDLDFQHQEEPAPLDQVAEDAATLRLLILSAQDPHP